MTNSNPKILFKYVTAKGLIKILDTEKLKWSAARLFNDPFDMQLNPWEFSLKEYRDVLGARVSKAVFGDEIIPETANPHLLKLRDLHINNPTATVEKINNVINEWCDDLVKAGSKIHGKLKSRVQYDLENARVFCMAAKHDNILMWAHYADKHEGAVLEFQEKDNFLKGIDKVIYQEELPTSKFIPKLVDLSVRLSDSPVGKDILITKSDHWIYEQEWRLIWPADDPTEEIEYHPFPPDRLLKIYLGCKIKKGNKRKILGLLKGEFKHVEILQASTNSNEFKLDFDPI